MTNPYEAPASGVEKEHGSRPSSAHRVVSALIAVLCGLQFAGVTWSVIAYMAAGGTGPDGAPIRFLPLAVTLLMPLSLFLGGIFLVLGRTVSGVFFAAYLVQYLLNISAYGGAKALPIVTGLAFLAYAVWRWKAGHLTGWPASPARAESDLPEATE